MDRSEKVKQSLIRTLFIMPCLIVLAWRFIEFAQIELTGSFVTLIFELIALAVVLVVSIKNKLPLIEFGLRVSDPKKTFGESFAIAAVLMLLGIQAKIAIVKLFPDFFPADAPFFRWRSRSLLGYFYIATCFVQEFLARGVLQAWLHKVISAKHQVLTVLTISALMFSVFHIHLGFVFMIGAGLLVAVLGLLYERHQNIWGAFVVHYLVGYTYIHLFIPA